MKELMRMRLFSNYLVLAKKSRVHNDIVMEEQHQQGTENFLRFLNRKGNDHSFIITILSYTGDFIILYHSPTNEEEEN